MGIFSRNFNKPGPGIEKDAPQKKGAALYFDMLHREFWNVCKVNLLFLLCCIPVVTVFPAYAAMTRVMLTIVRDEPVDVVYEFKKTFFKDFLQSFLMGIIVTAVAILLGVAIYFYGINNTILLYISLALGFLLLFMWIYIFPQLCYLTLGNMGILKNSFILAISCLPTTVGGVVSSGLIMGLTLLFYPLSIPFALFLTPALACLTSTFFAWYGIRKYVLREGLEETTGEALLEGSDQQNKERGC